MLYNSTERFYYDIQAHEKFCERLFVKKKKNPQTLTLFCILKKKTANLYFEVVSEVFLELIPSARLKITLKLTLKTGFQKSARIPVPPRYH